MSLDEQHRATERAREHREHAERLAEVADSRRKMDLDAVAELLAATVHLLLAIEDRLTYGYVSVLDGTVSCRVCRVILLESNAEGHYAWHERGES